MKWKHSRQRTNETLITMSSDDFTLQCFAEPISFLFFSLCFFVCFFLWTHFDHWGLLCIESENLASNSSSWDQGNAVLILGLKQNWILISKLHVRLAFMLTLSMDCLKTARGLSIVEDQRGRVGRLELINLEYYCIELVHLDGDLEDCWSRL